jgi:hypothetical protein
MMLQKRRTRDARETVLLFVLLAGPLVACQSERSAPEPARAAISAQPASSGDPTTKAEEDKKKMQRSVSELADGKHLVYPILKAADWPAKELSAFTFFLGRDKPPIPLIAYGYSTADNYVFVTKQELGARPIDELHKEALKNLCAVDIKWEKFDDHTLTASGHDFSAEKILCDDFLLEAEKTLKTKEILVAVPRRRVIYALDASAPDQVKKTFHYLVAHTLKDDSFGNALITNLMFQYQGKQVVKAFEVKQD